MHIVADMAAERKPVRVRKARWPLTCPLCGELASGQQLVMSVHHGPWVHAGHVVHAADGTACTGAARDEAGRLRCEHGLATYGTGRLSQFGDDNDQARQRHLA